MKEHKISGVKVRWSHAGEQIFAGFRLRDISAEVDPFVDSVFRMEFATDKDELEWARKQIGKTLKCDDFIYTAVATSGKVEII